MNKNLGAALIFSFLNFINPALINVKAESNNLEKKVEEIEWGKIDEYYWKPWEFYQYGGRWHIMDDFAVLVKDVYIDSLLNPLSPAPPETKRYYLVVETAFRALKGSVTLDPSQDFGIIDEQRIGAGKRPMNVSDYEGRDINGNIKRGMYNKLNPGKLKHSIYPYHAPEDEMKIGASREVAYRTSRKIPFAISKDWPTGHLPVGSVRQFTPYFNGMIWFCHNRHKIEIYNYDEKERIYEVEKSESDQIKLDDYKVKKYFSSVEQFFKENMGYDIILKDYRVGPYNDYSFPFLTYYFDSESKWGKDSVHVPLEKNKCGKWGAWSILWHLSRLPKDKNLKEITSLPPKDVELE